MNPLQEPLTGAASVGVCHGTSCSMAFCEDVLEAGYDHAARSVPVRRCGCLGHCDEGSNVVYDGVVYTDMDPNKMRALLARLGLSG